VSAAPKPRKCGAYTRRRGYTFEAEFVKFMNEGDVPCRRHFMSGMFEKGDCTISPTCMDVTLKGQLKRKKKIPDWLELDGHDFTAVREDRGETFVVIRASLFRDLLQ
jgi:hypothetical protein